MQSVFKDSEDPDWPDQIAVDYRFEEPQQVISCILFVSYFNAEFIIVTVFI